MPDNIVEIRNLSRHFGGQTALADVSISISSSLVCGLVGENGAGKTTLIKHVMGLLKARVGSVRVFGLNPVDDPVGVLGRIGYLSEDRDLPDWMRVIELMRYTQAFYPSWDEKYAEELRETFDLDPRQKIGTLSRGKRAQAGLLIALAHRPDLLVLDEPSSGLDAVVRHDILSAIIRTVADEGRTVLFSSHILEEIERVSDNVIMIHEGRVVMDDSLESIKDNHRKIALRFAEPLTIAPSLPGVLSINGAGRDWTAVCNGSASDLKEAVRHLGAEIEEETVPTLNEIFIARIRG